MKYQLVVLDMAGTTVRDDGTVLAAASTALTTVGVEAGTAAHAAAIGIVRDTMGQSKITVFRTILGDETRAARANTAFEAAYAAQVAAGAVTALPGAEDAISRMRDAGASVVLTTGFAASTQARILAALGWEGLVDLALTPGEGLRGRPYPDLVWTAAVRCGVDRAAGIALAGDSASDMACGANAGVGLIAGILGGAHDEPTLMGAGAHVIYPSVAALADAII